MTGLERHGRLRYLRAARTDPLRCTLPAAGTAVGGHRQKASPSAPNRRASHFQMPAAAPSCRSRTDCPAGPPLSTATAREIALRMNFSRDDRAGQYLSTASSSSCGMRKSTATLGAVAMGRPRRLIILANSSTNYGESFIAHDNLISRNVSVLLSQQFP